VEDDSKRPYAPQEAKRIKCLNINIIIIIHYYCTGLRSGDTSAEPLLSVSVQYVDADGVLHSVDKQLKRQDVFSLDSPTRLQAIQVMAKTAMCSVRQVCIKKTT
jgi:hypothetical protein